MSNEEIRSILNLDKIKGFPNVRTKYPNPTPITDGKKTYVVFDKKTGLIKIGRSTNYQLRIQTLNNKHKTNLVLLTVFNHDCEASLHDRYKHYHVGNEWFNMPIQILLDSVFTK